MCIIAAIPPKIPFPSLPVLARCGIRNPHGAGFAYATGGHLRIVKGLMSHDDLVTALGTHLGYEPSLDGQPRFTFDGPVTIHWRIGTQGANSKLNTHPWQVTADGSVCLLHNGIIDVEPTAPGADPTASDSQWYAAALAQLIPPGARLAAGRKPGAHGKPTPFGRVLQAHIEAFIGSRNKVVLMDKRGGVLICNEHLGERDTNGVWFSNSGWQNYQDAMVCDPRGHRSPRSTGGTTGAVRDAINATAFRRPKLLMGGRRDPSRPAVHVEYPPGTDLTGLEFET